MKIFRNNFKTASLIAYVCLATLFSFEFAGAQSLAPDAATRKITLKVMTINIRHNKDYWEDRFPLIADEIVRLKPDLIGLQEVLISEDQSKTLLKLINERTGDDLKYEHYDHLKTGAYMMSGEGVAVFSRFPIEKTKTIDLENGRVVIAARIRVNDDLSVDFYNTHLHHQGGDEVRLAQAEKIVGLEQKLNRGMIAFLTGDMNSHEDSLTIKEYLDNGFIDTFKQLHGDDTAKIGNTSPVIMSLTPVPQNFRNRIDFVFVKIPDAWKGRVAITDSIVCFKTPDERGLYPSDHLGVMTTFEIQY